LSSWPVFQSFKRTHEKYAEKFNEDELSAMNYAQAGNSYCECRSGSGYGFGWPADTSQMHDSRP
jgi:hypothetical protein